MSESLSPGVRLDLVENVLRTVLSTSHDAVYVLDTDAQILYFNDIAAHIIKHNGHIVEKGMNFRNLTLAENLKIFDSAFQNALGGESTIAETKNHLGDQTRWLQHKMSPVRSADGSIKAVTLSSQDIEKVKSLEKAYSHSENRFRKIFNSVAHPVLLVNKEGCITLCNAATSRVFGYLMSELTGSPVTKLLPDCPLDGALNTDENSEISRSTVSSKGYHCSGREIDLELELSVFEDEHQSYVLISAEDVSIRIEYERALTKFNHELTLLNYINDSILKISEEERLLQSVCDCIVDLGKYRLAWFSLGTEAIGSDNVIPVNFCAGVTDYVKDLHLKTDSSQPGPTAMSILQGKTTITNNISTTPYFEPWLKRAQSFGISSSISIPVELGAGSRGSLNIYSAQIDAFDPHEVLILKRIGENLSQAIRNIRNEKEKFRAKYDLKERMKELRTLYEVNNILYHEVYSVHEGLHRIARILPSGWQHPSICVARIVFEGAEYLSDNYTPPVAVQESRFTTQDNKTGTIEIGYKEVTPPEAEGPFLKEERNLIDTLAEIIGVHYNERAAHIELRKSEANLKSAFDSTDVGYILTDAELNTISFNHAMESGYAQNTGLVLKAGKKLTMQVIPEKRKHFSAVVEQVKREQRPVSYESSYAFLDKQHYYNIVISPVIGATDQLIGYCISANDITNKKMLELEREQMINDLLQRNKDLEQFAFMVSHNIRAPLANILGLSKLFEMGLKPEDVNKAVEGIVVSANRLDSVLVDLNTILQQKRTGSERKVLINLRELIEEIISSQQVEVQKTNALIHVDLSMDTNIHCIKSALLNIFINIISNSIRFAKPGERPEIKIWSENAGHEIIIHFQDNGIGLDMEKFGDQVFGLYKRFTNQVEGKGVGLFMVKTQTDLLGGRIEIESKPNEGMHVILSLPR